MSSRKETGGFQPYQYLLFNGTFKLEQYRKDLNRREKGSPDMQHVIHTDMKRSRENQLYDRQLHQQLIGSRGLQWQHKQELQRLKKSERHAERDLVQLQRQMSKMIVLPLIERTPAPLTPITEEELTFPPVATSRSPRKSKSWLKQHRFPHVLAKTNADRPYSYFFQSQKISMNYQLRQE